MKQNRGISSIQVSTKNTMSNFQGWVFAMAKTIFAGTVEKTGKNRGKN